MKISIIIPNLNSPIVDETIESLLKQKTNYYFEIIVIGQDIYRLVEKYTNESVHFYETIKPTPPGIARNIGVEKSEGDYIFFIDSDCVAPPFWIEKHMSLHNKFIEQIVVGGGVNFPTDNFLQLADNVSTFHEYMLHIKPKKKKQLVTCNMSLSRELWDKNGVFYSYPVAEDAEYTSRLYFNHTILYFEPEAFIYHKPNRKNIMGIFRHAFRFGIYTIKGNKEFQKKNVSSLIFTNKYLTLFFSPLISMYVIIKIILFEKLPFRYWISLPLVFLLKIIWCFGYFMRESYIK
jgi:glycosyltransferase involved in cell wall biosynthesis